jgi:hypothetical protein
MTMVYGVTIQTLDRLDGNGVTMVFIDAGDATAAEVRARHIGRSRYGCEVVAGHAVPCPGFAPSELSAAESAPEEHGGPTR